MATSSWSVVRVLRGGAAMLLVALSTGCSTQDTPSAPGGIGSGGSTTTVTAADLAFCLQETNRYRTMAGVAPVVASSDLDAYALRVAQADHTGWQAHGYTNGPGRPGGAFAENEALRWPHTVAIRDVIASATAQFWAEGPGGGHYENLRGPWRLVGCGVYVEGGAVTFVQHFRP